MQLDGRSGRVRASLAVVLSAGVLTSLWAWQRLAAGEGVAGEVDVTDQVSIKSDEAPLRASRDRYYVRAIVTNVSEKALAGPLALVIDETGVEDFPVANSDGFLASGKPYLWLVAEGAVLEAGAKSAEVQVKFASEGRLRLGQRREFELSCRVVQISSAGLRDRNREVADASPRPMAPGTPSRSASDRGSDKGSDSSDPKPADKPGASDSSANDPEEVPKDEEDKPGRPGKPRPSDLVDEPLPSEEEVAKVIKIQNAHTRELLKTEGVTSVATSYDKQGNAVIRVGVERAGIAKDLPEKIEGVRVVTLTTGKMRPLWAPPQDKIGSSSGTQSFVPLLGSDVQVRFDRPTPIGVSSLTSILPGFVGTMGARVVDLNGNVYGLSNFHVWADATGFAIGDSLLQPSPGDGGVDPADSIGTLAAFAPIDFTPPLEPSQVDAALCATTADIVGNSTAPGGYGTPSGTTCEAVLGLKVQKIGRTTGHTTGSVVALNVAFPIAYNSGTAFFTEQIEILGTNGPGTFGAGGDSGSLIVTLHSRQPVALLFAGNSVFTEGNPIDLVLEQLGTAMGISGLKIDGPPTP